MKELAEFIPPHVMAFLQSQQDQTLQRGLAFIAQLDSEESYRQAFHQFYTVEKTAKLLIGFLLISYQEAQSRDFLHFISKQGLSKSTAYDYMNEAKAFIRLPDAKSCEQFAQIGSMKVRLISTMPAQDFERFWKGQDVFGITIDEVDQVAFDDFKELFTAYKKRLDGESNKEVRDLKTQLKTLEHQRDELLKEREHRRIDGELPDRFVTHRVESRAQAYAAGLCLDSLEAIAVDVLTDLKNAEEEADQHYANAASTSLYSHVKALASRSVALEKLLAQRLPEAITGNPTPTPYTQEEIEIAVQRERSLRDEHTTAQMNRELERQTSKKKARNKKA